MRDITEETFSMPETTRKIDERKLDTGISVKRIIIDSAIADVNVIASNAAKIEAHLYGQVDKEEDIDFDFEVTDAELKVKLRLTGCCYNSRLKLDITVPHKGFKVISIKSLIADITLGKGIITEHLEVKNKFGDLETDARFNTADIATVSGDVEIYVAACKDIDVKVTTVSGNVFAEFENISAINLSERTKKRNVKNRHTGGVGHTANVDISTESGDIRLR